MVFSSNLFIFGFAPFFFSFYFLLPMGAKNVFVLIASLTFYTFGVGKIVFVLVFSIVLNWTAANLMILRHGRTKQMIFISTIVVNVVLLLYYKYAGFFWDVGNDVMGGRLLQLGFVRPDVDLPIGISFFTFQALSYVADVYTDHCRPARSLINFGMYHSLFPQLIAGPIVRYIEIEESITKRTTSLELASEGAIRFIIGLAKKIIIADSAGAIVDQIFKLDVGNLTPSIAWLGVVAYSIQILFDFSGYSDMAIGLGLLLGFRFPENFNRPYQSQNVTEFWRRWHMTLSRWFRDYVYFPLGGNRRGRYRTYLNLIVVFFLCGLWHGASYKFVIWGLYHGGLLTIERVLAEALNLKPAGLVGRVWTMLAVLVGWVFFRAADMNQASEFFQSMAFLSSPQNGIYQAINFLPLDRMSYLILGAIIALYPFDASMLPARLYHDRFALSRISAILLFLYSAMALSTSTFNPFIYFRF